MDEIKKRIWPVMLCELKNNKNTLETKKIFSVYCQGIITVSQVQNWFSKFHSGDTSLTF